MGKEAGVYYAMEYSSDICNDMGGTKEHYAEWKTKTEKDKYHKPLLHVEKQRTDKWLPEASGRTWEKHSNVLFK